MVQMIALTKVHITANFQGRTQNILQFIPPSSKLAQSSNPPSKSSEFQLQRVHKSAWNDLKFQLWDEKQRSGGVLVAQQNRAQMGPVIMIFHHLQFSIKKIERFLCLREFQRFSGYNLANLLLLPFWSLMLKKKGLIESFRSLKYEIHWNAGRNFLKK